MQEVYYKNEEFSLINKELIVTSDDPIIILNKLKIKSNFVKLYYVLCSSKNATFQLFYKENDKHSYTESDSYKVAIKKGLNRISLSFPAKYVDNELRIDLVDKTGKYTIEEFSIYEMRNPS